MDNLNDYKDLAHQSYSDNGHRKNCVGDWNQIGGSRHVGVYQNKKTGEINQAISGSRSISDFVSDGLKLFGIKNQHYLNREHEAKEMAQRIQRIRGHNKHSIVGHSLGGTRTNEVINKGMGHKGYTFNTFQTHHDHKLAKHHNITNIRNKGDLASILTRHNSNTVNLDTDNNSLSDVKNHFLHNIKI